jgi:hypothetical protein
MRRFLKPWSIEEANNACFIVRDSTGQGRVESDPAMMAALGADHS